MRRSALARRLVALLGQHSAACTPRPALAQAAVARSLSTTTPAAAATQHSSFQQLPVVDIAPLVAWAAAVPATPRPPPAVLQVASQLNEACASVGFFYVTQHGLDQRLCDGARDLARAWFALPEPVKRELLLSPATNYRGYQPLLTNVTRYETDAGGAGFTPDMHEALDFYKEAPRSAASPLHGPNPWPSQLPGFSEALQAYVAGCLRLGATLLRGLALGLGLQQDAFTRPGLASPEESYWVLRAISYPPLQQSAERARAAALGESGREVQLSCGEHQDYGLLTLVNQDPGVTALQVKNAAGQWVNAPPLPGTLVCNIGDMFERLTNGAWRPTLHRVLHASPAAAARAVAAGSNDGGAAVKASAARVSLPFFYEPGFDSIIAPLPQLCRGSPPAYAPVRYGSHLESKVLTNFEL